MTIEHDLLPVRPREQGVLFDPYVSPPQVRGLPLEDLPVPTLVINAEDDPASAFGNVRRVVERLPCAELGPIPAGGHLVLGSGGRWVRWNGRVYERLVALRERRPARDLYHPALLLRRDATTYAVEMGLVWDSLRP
jgi:hypothetical protein